MTELERAVKVGTVWKHFKGKHYAVINSLATHTETEECMVIYTCIHVDDVQDSGIFARPLEMFLEEVDHEKYPNAEQKYRFERIA